MSDTNRKPSRRDFLKAFSLASAIPLFPGIVTGQETTATADVQEPKAGGIHRIVTANILASLSEHDGTPVDWETQRKDVCFKVLKDQKADIICLQEVLRSQYEDFDAGFPEFQKFGYPGPHMDKNLQRFQGVKNVIMFSRDRYEMTSAGSYALSETPLIEGSTGWGEKLGRHVNWVRLKDSETDKEFRVLNTHFFVRNTKAQEFAAKMIVEESGQYQEDFPQLLAGDFNANDTKPAIKIIKDGGWTDTFEAVHGEKDAGWTFTGFRPEERDPEAEDVQIDWIFCRGKVKPVAAKVIWDKVNGHFPSDHLFVSADVQLTSAD